MVFLRECYVLTPVEAAGGLGQQLLEPVAHDIYSLFRAHSCPWATQDGGTVLVGG